MLRWDFNVLSDHIVSPETRLHPTRDRRRELVTPGPRECLPGYAFGARATTLVLVLVALVLDPGAFPLLRLRRIFNSVDIDNDKELDNEYFTISAQGVVQVFQDDINPQKKISIKNSHCFHDFFLPKINVIQLIGGP